MSSTPVGRFLKDISGTKADVNASFVSDFPLRGMDEHGRGQDVEEARTLGLLEGRAAAEAEFNKEIARRVEELEARFAKEREVWAQEQGAALSAQFTQQLDDLERRIADDVNAILGPFVTQALRQRAVDELASLLRSSVADGDVVSTKVSGPDDLLEALKATLGEREGVQYAVEDTPEVMINVDGTILSTRIAEWLRLLEGEPS